MFEHIEPIVISIILAFIVLLMLSCICKHFSSKEYALVKYDEESPPPYEA
jgi:hypothetical protein